MTEMFMLVDTAGKDFSGMRSKAWFILVYYRILMVCGRGSKNGKGGNCLLV